MEAPSVAMSAAGMVIAMAKPSNQRIRFGRCVVSSVLVTCSVDMGSSRFVGDETSLSRC